MIVGTVEYLSEINEDESKGRLELVAPLNNASKRINLFTIFVSFSIVFEACYSLRFSGWDDSTNFMAE